MRPFNRLILAVMGALLWATSAMALDVGQTAPEFDLPGKATPVKLSDYKGQFVYLDFWASWCGPCRQSFPWMNDIQARYAKQGLTIVGINVDSNAADAASFLAANPAKFTTAFDTKGVTPGRYGVKGMPTSALIGPDGKVVFVHAGFKPEESAQLEQKIRAAMGIK